MFFLPKILKGPFNRYYVIAASSHMLSGSWNTQSVDLTASAYGFVRQLYVSDHYWEQLLDAYAHRDWRYTNQTIIERVCALLESRRVNAYEVPNPDAPHSSISCSFTDNKTATRYIFLPGNAHLLIQTEERRTFASLQSAESFLASAQLDDEQVNLLVSQLKEDPFSDNSARPRKRLAQAMVTGALSVGIARASAGAKSQSAPASEEFVSSERPPTLGPHDEPGYVAPKPAAATTPVKPLQAPQTLEEAAQRLRDAKPAVLASKASGSPLPASSYTHQDKQSVVENGLQEKFLVRVIDSDHAGDDGFIGKVREHGSTISWTAPLTMVEHGDTDAEALLNAFGTRHNPEKSYTVLIIDREKMNEIGDVQTIIPTNENLHQLIAENPQLTKVEPEMVKQVLNEDFAPKYEAFAKGMWANKINEENPRVMRQFAIQQGFTSSEADLLVDRHHLANDVAAWEVFTGNGMTRDTNAKNGVAYGPVEVVMLDKKPMRLGYLQQENAVAKI